MKQLLMALLVITFCFIVILPTTSHAATQEDVIEMLTLLNNASEGKLLSRSDTDDRETYMYTWMLGGDYCLVSYIAGEKVTFAVIFIDGSGGLICRDIGPDGEIDMAIALNNQAMERFDRLERIELESEDLWQEIFDTVIADTIKYLKSE